MNLSMNLSRFEKKDPLIIIFYDNYGRVGTMETSIFMRHYAHKNEFLENAVERFNIEKEDLPSSILAKIDFKTNL